eukprot:jgi/Tetstr1/421775/TSEL_012678.t1
MKTCKASNNHQTRARKLKRENGELKAAINKLALANDEIKAHIKALPTVADQERAAAAAAIQHERDRAALVNKQAAHMQGTIDSLVRDTTSRLRMSNMELTAGKQ